jgi:dolichol-phosphate mannosyltransferase
MGLALLRQTVPADRPQVKLSIVIPAHNEEGSIAETLRSLHAVLVREGIDHEIVVVNDHSKDGTGKVLADLGAEIDTLRALRNEGPGGYGFAVRWGLEHYTGDCVAVMMADLSDDPADLVRFYRKMGEGFDCVFGTRWSRGGKVYDYPWIKKMINRTANNLVRFVFRMKYNDCTNAFKLYRRTTIDGIKPFLSPHFNLTLELPLKAIVRGYNYAVLPNSWRNRKAGESKLKIKEMGSRYFFIMLYCLIEKHFSRGDFMKR